MTTSPYRYQIALVCLSVAITTFCCVLQVPLFPAYRSANTISYFGKIPNVVCIIALCFPIYPYWLNRIRGRGYTIFPPNNTVILPSNTNSDSDDAVVTYNVANDILLQRQSHNAADITDNETSSTTIVDVSPCNKGAIPTTALFFCTGFSVLQVLKILNQLMGEWTGCFNLLAFFDYFVDLIFALQLLFVMKHKQMFLETNGRFDLLWSICGAACFITAFKYALEEMILTYIEIVIHSIEYKEYGLHIPENITNADNYVYPIFKRRTKCFENWLLHKTFDNYFSFLEFQPFSTEYFSMATVFIFLMWKSSNSDHSHEKNIRSASNSNDENIQNSEHIQNSDSIQILNIHNPENVQNFENIQNPQSIENLLEKEVDGCKWKYSVIISVFLMYVCTIGLIIYFLWERVAERHSIGVIIFKFQETAYQIALLVIEGLMYSKLRHLEAKPSPPSHFRLDVILLVFPLFPLGVFLTLRVLPYLTGWNFAKTALNPHCWALWGTAYLILAFLQFFQTAFQTFFIVHVFCTLENPGLRKYRYVFRILYHINVCLWISWVFESKSVTLFGRSSIIYGVVHWTIIVYLLIPFLLFYFAHSAACFSDIFGHIKPMTRNTDSVTFSNQQ